MFAEIPCDAAGLSLLFEYGRDPTVNPQPTMELKKLWTGCWTAEHEGVNCGGIQAEQPAGGIRQAFVAYEAVFKPHPEAPGFTKRGTVHQCKRFMNDWAKATWG